MMPQLLHSRKVHEVVGWMVLVQHYCKCHTCWNIEADASIPSKIAMQVLGTPLPNPSNSLYHESLNQPNSPLLG